NFERDGVPGAYPEEVMGVKALALIIPGDDPSHATSGAHYLRECLPNAEFWNVMPPEQSTKKVCDRILEFCRERDEISCYAWYFRCGPSKGNLIKKLLEKRDRLKEVGYGRYGFNDSAQYPGRKDGRL